MFVFFSGIQDLLLLLQLDTAVPALPVVRFIPADPQVLAVLAVLRNVARHTNLVPKPFEKFHVLLLSVRPDVFE